MRRIFVLAGMTTAIVTSAFVFSAPASAAWDFYNMGYYSFYR